MRGKLLLLIVPLFTLAVYSLTLFNGFVYDDYLQVMGNRWIKDAGYIFEILTSSGTGFQYVSSNTYRPLLHLAFMAEYPIFGFEAWGYHLVNMILHALNALLVGLTALRLLDPDGQKAESRALAVIAGLLFAAHPINAEAVSWVSAIPELTYTLFLLLAFYLYIGSGFDSSFVRRLFGAVLFFIALLGKETAMSLLFLIAAYEFSVHGIGAVRQWRRYMPFVVTAACYMALRTYSVGGVMHHKQANFSPSELILNIFPLVFQYFWKLFLPIGLRASYVLTPVRSLFDPAVIAGAAIALLTLAAFFLARRKKVLPVLFMLIAPLLPVLYIPALSNSAFAERYLYLPSAGLAIAAVFVLKRLMENRMVSLRAAVVLASAVVVVFSAASVKRELVWKNDISLWEDTISKEPKAKYAHYNLALAYNERHNDSAAIEHYKEAIRLDPSYVSAHYNLAWNYQKSGDTGSALSHYAEVVRLAPRSSDAHVNMGIIYKDKGMYGAAVSEFQAALAINPGFPGAREKLSEALALRDANTPAVQ